MADELRKAAEQALVRMGRTYVAEWERDPAGHVCGDVNVVDVVTVIRFARAALAAPEPDHVARELATVRPAIQWPIGRDVSRTEDMGSGYLRVLLDSDNDVVVEVWNGERSAAVEFCNGGGGGGRSMNTRVALIQLMSAIEKDNAERPIKAAPASSSTEPAQAEPVAFHHLALRQCLTCGTDEVSIERTCHNSKCAAYATPMIVANVADPAPPPAPKRTLSAAEVDVLDAVHRRSTKLIEPAPKREPLSLAHHVALREAHCIAAERDYFNARPGRLSDAHLHQVFEAGFARGFDAAIERAHGIGEGGA